MLRNLGGAVGTASLQTIITKREQYHSNIMGQSVTVFNEATRNRFAELTSYFLAHGVSDPAVAEHKAVITIGNVVHRQALVQGFSDEFGAIGVALLLAAIAILFACKVRTASSGAGSIKRIHTISL